MELINEYGYPIRTYPGMIVSDEYFVGRLTGDGEWFDLGYRKRDGEHYICDTIDSDSVRRATADERKRFEEVYKFRPENDIALYVKGVAYGNAAASALTIVYERQIRCQRAYYFEDVFMTKKGDVEMVENKVWIQADLYALTAGLKLLYQDKDLCNVAHVFTQSSLTKSVMNYFGEDEHMKADGYIELLPEKNLMECKIVHQLTKKNEDDIMHQTRMLAERALFETRTIFNF